MIIRQNEITGEKNAKLLVSTALLDNGTYETGVFNFRWEELAVSTSCSVESAETVHEAYLKEFSRPVVLTGGYAKLAACLMEAVQAAKKAADEGDDSGTCCFDAMRMYAPKWKRDSVEAAAEKAGLHVHAVKDFRKTYYQFSVPCGGQASARTRQAEAMAKVMAGYGYDASVYYRMD